MPAPTTRLERDLLGTKSVPAEAYYGVQTVRGLENFHISGVELRLYPDLQPEDVREALRYAGVADDGG